MNMGADEKSVVITGLGPVTSIGVGNDALWPMLAAGRTTVHRRTLPVDAGKSVEVPLASMPPSPDVPGLGTHMDFIAGQGCIGYRDLAYSLLAMELALADARLDYDRRRNNIGVIQAFEAPGVERAVSRLFELVTAPTPPGNGPPPLYEMLAPCFYNMQAFLYVHLAGKALGLHGFSTSVHNACASGAFAIEVAAQRIRSGQADVMIVVGGEAFETAVRLEWFRRLDLYATDQYMRPFDAESSGFYVGEGAAALVLESAAHAADRGASPYAAYLGGAFAHQGWKQAVPDVRAARLRDVITQVLTDTGVSPGDLDLIVPHGAGTMLGDGYEASCLAQALDKHAPQAVATAFKPYVGHMLAASGLIETICALLAMKHDTIPATLNSRPEHVQLAVPLATERLDRPFKTILKLSNGFTGHDAASLFAKV